MLETLDGFILVIADFRIKKKLLRNLLEYDLKLRNLRFYIFDYRLAMIVDVCIFVF